MLWYPDTLLAKYPHHKRVVLQAKETEVIFLVDQDRKGDTLRIDNFTGISSWIPYRKTVKSIVRELQKDLRDTLVFIDEMQRDFPRSVDTEEMSTEAYQTFLRAIFSHELAQ
jgi:thiol-disulfide isomerase/thioredoxin